MQCAKEPWYENEKYIQYAKEHPEVLKTIGSIKETSTKLEESNECYRACPPWQKICTMQCAKEPWYMNEKYMQYIKEHPEVAKYITSEKGASDAVEKNSECYSACPPWQKICTKQCADKPWYENQKYVKIIEIARKYMAGHPEYDANTGCYRACPPWEICTTQCADKPWYA